MKFSFYANKNCLQFKNSKDTYMHQVCLMTLLAKWYDKLEWKIDMELMIIDQNTKNRKMQSLA